MTAIDTNKICLCENYEKLSSRLMVIGKSIELFVDTYCHTMLADREVVLSHGRISRNGILVFGRYCNNNNLAQRNKEDNNLLK